jgi:hypothetical protein
VLIVRGTKKLLDRVGPPALDPPASTTSIGDWYANPVAGWRPQVALFTNAATFFPVLVAFAPARTVLARFPGSFAQVATLLGIDHEFIADETAEMRDVTLAKTASRQVLGVMTEFAVMANHATATRRTDPTNLVERSAWLATTIVGPIPTRLGSTPLSALHHAITDAGR